MLYVLTGDDEFSLRQSLEEIRHSLGDQAALASNTARPDGEHLRMDHLRVACETMPFLADKRLVIVEGLLEHFEARNRPGAKKRSPDQKEEVKTLAAYLVQIPPFTTLVLVSGKVNARNPLLTELSGKAEVKYFPTLKGIDLQAWIERRIKEAGASMTPAAVALLARYVGGNLSIMANEIEKLVLFSPGTRIEEKDVKAVVSSAQEANVFAMVDAILASRADVAGQLMQKLLDWGAAPAYLLTMLARQAQMIVRARELLKQSKSRAEIQERLGVAEFAARKTLEQADRYSLSRLREVYHHILEADLAIKTGRYDGELALLILIAALCRDGAAKYPTRGPR